MEVFSNISLGISGTLRVINSSFVLSSKALQVILDLSQNKKDPELHIRLREAFEELGATYIKLGQFIASAPSLFPKEYTIEMEKCLDSVRPLPFGVIRETIEKELGGKVENFFQYVDPIPLASASISQVHAATTRSGLDVVIKVQRPDIETTLKTDMGLIYVATLIFSKLAPGITSSGLTDIVKDFYENIIQEVDFIQEAKNISDFEKYLFSRNEERAKVPRVFHDFSTKRILTMERLYGIPLTNLNDIKKYSKDPRETLTTALAIWFESLGNSEVFHADVHAGNLLLLRDGKIGFIDFGIVGRISKQVWGGLLFFMQGIGSENPTLMAKGLVMMDSTSKGINENRFAEDLNRVIQEMRTISETIKAGRESELDEARLNKVMFDIADISKRNGLKIPREFGLLIKQMLYFDRYVKILAPEMDLIKDQKLYIPQ
ncbi:MAG: AarF/ABC1/UbiB kinase family protein [Spirochaetia bacterium]|nr:AarF/ABC1/UbiB kinase family protein [Spirochaetia bacterium]